MAIIKCKMCGGDIEISADKTFGTCEYCGSTMTLPKTDDDQRLSLFNRGTHLRRNGEFDKAAAIYERLIGENDADAEAHWNLLLCRYGIEYVQDPASGERIPTCHRASRSVSLGTGLYRPGLPQRTLSPRPRSALATAGRFAWGVSSARLASLKSLRRS